MVHLSITTGLCLAILVAVASGLPPRRVLRQVEPTKTNNFVADGTNALATALLQGFVDTESNQAFSPLGLSALMAILAEGAEGKTKAQLVSALRFPEDAVTVRESYNEVLSRLTEKYVVNRPEFKNWFYIYKNYTVEQKFRDILKKHYLTDVKDVENPDRSVTVHSAQNDKIIIHTPLALGNEDYIKVTIGSHKHETEPESPPMKFDKTYVKITLPEMIPYKDDEDDEAEMESVDVVKPVTEIIKDDTPMKDDVYSRQPEQPVINDMLVVVQEKKPKKPCLKRKSVEFQGGQEDYVRNHMKKEATLMNGAIGEQVIKKKVDIKEFTEQMEECEQEIEKLEAEVMKTEEVKEAMLEEMKTEEDIKAAMDEKIKKQEAIREVIEKEMNKKEEIISALQAEMLQKDEMKDVIKEIMESPVITDISETKPAVTEEVDEEQKLEEAFSMNQVIPTKDGQIKVLIVTMTDEEVRRDAMKNKEVKIKESEKPMIQEKLPMGIEIQTAKPFIVEEEEKLMSNLPVKQAIIEEKPTKPVRIAVEEMIKPAPVKLAGAVSEMPDKTIKSKQPISMETKDKIKDGEEEKPLKEHVVMHIKPTKIVKPDLIEVVKEDEKMSEEKPMSVDEITPSKPEMTKLVLEEMSESKPMKEPVVEEEHMIAMERQKRSVKSLQPISTGLSSNNVVSKTVDENNKAKSLMIMFNALYFRGTWSTPFVRQLSGGAEDFFVSETKTLTVPMMHAEGSFSIGKVPELDSVAIELPYEGGRYSLLVILPNSRNGLRRLISDLSGFRLCDIKQFLSPLEVEVCLPSFEVETTTKPMRTLAKFGVSDVFSREKANLANISPDQGLFVQELSQLVTIKVDLTSSKTNFLTASNAYSATNRDDAEKFVANHPFLYFVRDVVDNMVIIAGKVTNPTDLPPLFPEV